MPKAIKLGKRERQTFSKIKEVAEMPNLIQIQTKSYDWFMKDGIKEVFEDISPIRDYAGKYMLEFVDYHFDEKPKYTVEECKDRDATYSVPMKAKVRLYEQGKAIIEDEVFMGDFPLMTKQGTFIYNGAERAVVTQLVRSSGAYFGKELDKYGNSQYTTTLIPNRGAWLEYITDNNGETLSVRVDRTRKQPITVLIRAMDAFIAGEQERFGANLGLSLESSADILKLFGDDEQLLATLEKDNTTNSKDALIEIYRKLRPGEPPSEESAFSMISGLFFDSRRYDVSKVGRYKYNKKLGVSNRLENTVLAEELFNPMTGEQLAEEGEKITLEKAIEIENAGVKEILVYRNDEQSGTTKIIGNHFVDIKNYVDFDISDIKLKKVYYPVLMQILEQYEDEAEIKQQLINRKNDLYPKHLLIDDILASISYLLNLPYAIGREDDIDHLGNRRLRSVGELIQNQFRIGVSRMEKIVKERMTTQDGNDRMLPALINIRPLTSAIREFFGSSQLSQFMDQNNPLAELTHKRRLSALGPGGLSRDRAGFEVRDVHYSHYGRMCPIETPEGPNIGLIGSLTTYANINEYGFIETPYRIVKDGVVSEEIRYLSADDEERMVVAQANEPLDSEGKFLNKRIAARGVGGEVDLFEPAAIDYMDVSPKQVVSVATAMIPFLENDDANRALMGANMQRQAVPLLVAEAPIVGTGVEYRAAKDSGAVVVAEEDGEVIFVDADVICIKGEDGAVREYKLLKFKRSNQGTCIHQKPIVFVGEKVKAGEVIADGPSTDNGEIALGKNLLIAFMTWEGYNYEDAIILNERLIMDDILTSLHIEKYETEARKTKLGDEEITRDIPGVGADALKDLDEYGIVRIGAEVSSSDILVGKITPKGEKEQTGEERLMRSIFGEKINDVRDTSLKMPHGESGVVVGVKEFSRENDDEMKPGVNKIVRCYVATKRKISVGDKMAGRHGNKGVISKILPEEDMPFMEDGTPIQVMLNPLGVPSRMNVGQVLEVHLGLAAKKMGWHVATPVFDGANEKDIIELLKECGYSETGKVHLRDGRSGEFFDNPVTVGYMYMLKLHHLVDDKIHARSVGTYSKVTQQPLGGKAQFGGQRFGEMEVWALEAYGAAYTLQEILTVKSDDIIGRVETYEAIVKGNNVPEAGVPESFKVLIKELQSLALDVTVMTETDEEIDIEDSTINEETETKLETLVDFEEIVDEAEVADNMTFEDEE
ncbi:MAG: DNA-directed RNA polymerase subunit beta [Eubacteriales bacterium]|nr:DNA-directed RNA polymerase subunit beta [Eubacteriales bacterium]MDY3333245.1 DNA-directed RNA polymerase subunit beta [Gallibacter sp.]